MDCTKLYDILLTWLFVDISQALCLYLIYSLLYYNNHSLKYITYNTYDKLFTFLNISYHHILCPIYENIKTKLPIKYCNKMIPSK